MGNLSNAKEIINKNKAIEELINPTPEEKKLKLPLQRDINLIEDALTQRINKKTEEIKEEIINNASNFFEPKLTAIHEKAVKLKQEIKLLAKEIESHSKGILTIKLDNYTSGYFEDLPNSIQEAKEKKEYITIEENKITPIKEMKNKKDEFMLQLKIGLAQMADVKPLLDEIENIKI